MGLSCYRIRNRFSELLDGRLSEADRAAVQRHLAGCEGCAGDYELFRKTQELVAGLRPIQVSPDFTEQVLARVRRLPAEEEKNLQWASDFPSDDVPHISIVRRHTPMFWTTRVAAAAAVAAVSLGLWQLMAHPRASSVAVPASTIAASGSAAHRSQHPSTSPDASRMAGVQAAPVVAPSAAAGESGTRGNLAGRHAAGRGRLRSSDASGPALADKGAKAYKDSLYDQPFHEDMRSLPVYTRTVSASPESGVQVVPVSSQGRGADK